MVVSSEGKHIKSVEDLDVFKLAHQLALKTYAVTKGFPREETFSLVDQMRRAASLARGYQCAAHFDVLRILKTCNFPALLGSGERFERLELSVAVERFERAAAACKRSD